MPEWTKEQKRAIEENGSNILVAAAAGSGKTTVLVERIIQKIINNRIDIDKLLIVTFTNAAASEMRERILNALYKKIDEDPNNIHLQRQIVLLNKASICTIDSFCLDIVKNNFYEIGISPNFRIADNTELEILKQEALEDLFEELYLNKDKNFIDLINTYATYRGDENLKDLVLRIYDQIQSNPYPEEWLNSKIEEFNVESKIDKDFIDSIWGKILIENYKNEIIDEINNLKLIKSKISKYAELEKYVLVLLDDIESLENVVNSLYSWDEAYEVVNNLKFKTWPSDKKIVMDIKDIAKSARDHIKDKFKKITGKTFVYKSKEAYEDIYSMYSTLKAIGELVNKFTNIYNEKKKEKNIMEFGDIEHSALNILMKKDDSGKRKPSDVALKLRDKFEEIAIDEYQDSNLVQEYILTSISNGKNIFMVGDVKQSIYKFRQARPELFLDKYEKYGVDTNEYGTKIQLFKNFRSRKSILDITNLIFSNIMSKDLGDIDYNEEEYLNFSANFEDPEEDINYAGKVELHVIDLKQDEEKEDIYKDLEDEEIKDSISVDESSEERKLEKAELEAKYVAYEIKKLIDSNYKVFDKKEGYRNIKYRDIVILLRATSSVSNIFEKELYDIGIPVFSDTSDDYLESLEIQKVISLLKVIDNPYQDIPLLSVLRSPICDFSDDEITSIRLVNRNCYFYTSLEEALNSKDIKNITKTKIDNFIKNLRKWREEEKYLSLNELIWKIYIDTGYYSYVGLTKNGELKQANLKLLFEKAKDYEKVSFKGLFNFIKYLEKIKKSNNDMGAAKIIGENENVVRIMSIHKSKGLEFPVVFLARSDKQINMRSLNENILLDQDIGLGPKYINYERKIEYNTLARESIRLKSKIDSISEEMRVLYVALTRAKEKLIITGVKNDFEKDFENKKELLNIYENDNNKINHLLIQKYISYLDWIELVYLYNKDNIEDYIDLKVINEKEITFETEENKSITRIAFSDDKNLEKVDELLNWKYENIEDTLIPSKTSITKIKEIINAENKEQVIKESLENEDELESNIGNLSDDVIDKFEKEVLEIKPKFMQDTRITAAQRGTLMHLCFQKLDLKRKYSLDEIKEFVNKMVHDKIITEEEKNTIQIDKIYKFVNSDFAERIRKAEIIEKEKPFYTYVKASEVFENNSKENILVQGIIDLYFKEKDGNIVLVDYKTDYFKDDLEIKEKYKIQLDLYRKALESALSTEIKDVYIYSISQSREIKLI